MPHPNAHTEQEIKWIKDYHRNSNIKVESTKKKSLHLGKYDTPTGIGEKWQLDVKYVSTACYSGNDDEKQSLKRLHESVLFTHAKSKAAIQRLIL